MLRFQTICRTEWSHGFHVDRNEFACFIPSARGLPSSLMTEHTDRVTIKDGGRERLVRVFIEAPSLDGLDIRALAQEAWFRPGRMLRKGDVTVIVAKFKR
jgi:hypothetical protein